MGVPVILAVFGLSVAVARGNSLGYSIGDTFRLLSMAAIVVLGSMLPFRQYCSALAAAGLTFILFDAVTVAQQALSFIGGGGAYTRVSGGSLAAMGYSLFLFVRGTRFRRVGFVGFAISVTSITLSLGRAKWIAAVAMIAIVFLARPKVGSFKPPRGVRHRMALLGLVCLVAAWVFVVAAPQGGTTTAVLQDRVVSVVDRREGDSSISSRLSESSAALAEFGSTPLSSGVGLGSGATFDDAGTEVHHIHSTAVSVLVRHGLIGLVLSGLWFLAIGLKVVVALRSKSLRLVALSAFVIGTMITSLTAYTFVGDPTIGLALAGLIRKDVRDGKSDALRVSTDGV